MASQTSKSVRTFWIICVYCIFISRYASSSQNDSSNNRQWITQIMRDAKKSFDMDIPGVENKCRQEYRIYKQFLSNQTAWAIKMMESSQWPKVGILFGVNYHLGNWAECIRVVHTKVEGKYCIVQLMFNVPGESGKPISGWPDENISAWEVIKMHESNRFRVNRQRLNWAMCIPSACNFSDLKMSVDHSLGIIMKNQGFHYSVTVLPEYCRSAKEVEEKITHGTNTNRKIFYSIILFITLATIFDIRMNSSNDKDSINYPKIVKFLLCFSVKQSWKMVTKPLNETFLGIYLIKIIGMIVEIYVHSHMLDSMTTPNIAKEQAEVDAQSWSIGQTGCLMINIFFAFSGFLMTYHFNMKKSTSLKSDVIYLFQMIFFRWLRLVPMVLYTVVFIFLQREIFPPSIFMEKAANDHELACQLYWWKSIIGIQNFQEYDSMCQPLAWYVSVDLQLTIIGTILMLIYRRNKKAGLISIFGTLITASFMTFALTYVGKRDATLIFPQIENVDRILGVFKSSENLYINTISHINPYLAGCFVALIIRYLQNISYQFSRAEIVSILISTHILEIGLIKYANNFFNVERPYQAIESALFASLSPFFITFAALSIVCIDNPSKSGILKRFMPPKWFLYLERFVYTCYLINSGTGIWRYSYVSQVLMSVAFKDSFWLYVADVFMSFYVSFCLFFVIDGPTQNILKLIV